MYFLKKKQGFWSCSWVGFCYCPNTHNPLNILFGLSPYFCLSVHPTLFPLRTQAYLKPPPAVELTLAAVMTVLKKPPTWEEAKRQLGDSSFLESLLRYDKDRLDDVLLKKINRFTSNPDFAPEVCGSNPCPRVVCIYIIGCDRAEFILSSVGKQSRTQNASTSLQKYMIC